MWDHIEAILGIFLASVGVVTSVGGGLAWYRSRIAQDVARQRDFNHLKNNYQQMSKGIEELWSQNDDRFDHLFRQMDRLEMRLDPDKTLPVYKAPSRNV